MTSAKSVLMQTMALAAALDNSISEFHPHGRRGYQPNKDGDANRKRQRNKRNRVAKHARRINRQRSK